MIILRAANQLRSGAGIGVAVKIKAVFADGVASDLAGGFKMRPGQKTAQIKIIIFNSGFGAALFDFQVLQKVGNEFSEFIHAYILRHLIIIDKPAVIL